MVMTETRGFIRRDLAGQARQVNSRNVFAPDPLDFMDRRFRTGHALCLVFITLLSAVPYVWRLGFYSDDWYVLYHFHSETLQHSFGIQSALRYDEARPVQGLYLALLYQLFGFHPLGYH